MISILKKITRKFLICKILCYVVIVLRAEYSFLINDFKFASLQRWLLRSLNAPNKIRFKSSMQRRIFQNSSSKVMMKNFQSVLFHLFRFLLYLKTLAIIFLPMYNRNFSHMLSKPFFFKIYMLLFISLYHAKAIQVVFLENRMWFSWFIFYNC